MALKVRKNKIAAPIEPCAVSECMAMLGGAWTPNIIWFLRAGPRRFGELRIDIPAISAKMLSARLKVLEQKGIVTRCVAPTHPPSVDYCLTELGHALTPAIIAIAEIGLKLKAARQAAVDENGGGQEYKAIAGDAPI